MFSNKSWKENMKILLNKLVDEKVITSEIVYNAMLQVDRGDFVDSSEAYYDNAQSINYNATISAPHMHAYALEYLKDFIKPEGRVLDVGSGSGYLTVAFSKIMSDKGIVVGIEHINQLYNFAIENISKSHSNLINEKKLILVEADGRDGYSELAPYNCIHVGAAAQSVPQSLIDQLANGGRLMIPVGGQHETQYIYLIDKDQNGNINEQKILAVRYIPLTSKEKQLFYY